MSRVIGNNLMNFMEKMFMHLKLHFANCDQKVEKTAFLVESRCISMNTTLDILIILSHVWRCLVETGKTVIISLTHMAFRAVQRIGPHRETVEQAAPPVLTEGCGRGLRFSTYWWLPGYLSVSLRVFCKRVLFSVTIKNIVANKKLVF